MFKDKIMIIKLKVLINHYFNEINKSFKVIKLNLFLFT